MTSTRESLQKCDDGQHGNKVVHNVCNFWQSYQMLQNLYYQNIEINRLLHMIKGNLLFNFNKEEAQEWDRRL